MLGIPNGSNSVYQTPHLRKETYPVVLFGTPDGGKNKERSINPQNK
jgi:hypothetical protein